MGRRAAWCIHTCSTVSALRVGSGVFEPYTWEILSGHAQQASDLFIEYAPASVKEGSKVKARTGVVRDALYHWCNAQRTAEEISTNTERNAVCEYFHGTGVKMPSRHTNWGEGVEVDALSEGILSLRRGLTSLEGSGHLSALHQVPGGAEYDESVRELFAVMELVKGGMNADGSMLNIPSKVGTNDRGGILQECMIRLQETSLVEGSQFLTHWREQTSGNRSQDSLCHTNLGEAFPTGWITLSGVTSLRGWLPLRVQAPPYNNLTPDKATDLFVYV